MVMSFGLLFPFHALGAPPPLPFTVILSRSPFILLAPVLIFAHSYRALSLLDVSFLVSTYSFQTFTTPTHSYPLTSCGPRCYRPSRSVTSYCCIRSFAQPLLLVHYIGLGSRARPRIPINAGYRPTSLLSQYLSHLITHLPS